MRSLKLVALGPTMRPDDVVHSFALKQAKAEFYYGLSNIKLRLCSNSSFFLWTMYMIAAFYNSH